MAEASAGAGAGAGAVAVAGAGAVRASAHASRRPASRAATAREVVASTTARNGRRQGLAKGNGTKQPGEGQSAQASPSDRGDAVLGEIGSPARCTVSTVGAVCSTLQTTPSALGLELKPGGAKEQASDVGDVGGIVPASTLDFSAKRVHFAKQVVNASIQALNDLVSSGWHPPVLPSSCTSPPTAALSQKRASKTASVAQINATKSAHRARANVTSDAGTASASKPLTRDNALALSHCFQIAVRYLWHAGSSNEAIAVKAADLLPIVLTVARKLVSIELYDVAATELAWLCSGLYDVKKTAKGGKLYLLAIPGTDAVPSRLCHVLDAQALMVVCEIAQTPNVEAFSLLEDVLRHQEGPYSWQRCVRSLDNLGEGDTKAADRALYTVERAIMRLSARRHEDGNAESAASAAQLTFECRRASLQMLLLASDLDTHAYWDRAARVGASHFRTRVALIEKPTVEDKLQCFGPVDALFRELVTHADQTTSVSVPPRAQGEGFLAFCEHWTNMARRAGDASAIQYIGQLLHRNDPKGGEFAATDGETLDTATADTQASIACSTLALATVVLQKSAVDGKNNTEFANLTFLQNALGALGHCTAIWLSASIDTKHKVVTEVDHLRRQTYAYLEIKSGKQTPSMDNTTIKIGTSARLLVEKIADFLEQILQQSTRNAKAGSLPFSVEHVFDSCIQARRLLSRSTFSISSEASQQRSASLLEAACELAIRLDDSDVSPITRADSLRVLSSTWHSFGAQLYSDKKPQLAIRFLKSAVECGEASSSMFNRVADEALVETVKEAQVAQAEMLSKKWEHLAICFRIVGQGHLAEESYAKGLLAVPDRIWDLISSRAARLSNHEVFQDGTSAEQQRSVSEIASMARTAFEVQAFERLRFAKDEKTLFDELDGRISQEALCALMDFCLVSLQTMMHREDSPAVAAKLIGGILKRQSMQKYPLRRVQTLLRKFEMGIMMPKLPEFADEGSCITQEIQNGLSVHALGKDEALARFKPQLHAAFSLLMTLRASSVHSLGIHGGLERSVNETVSALKTITSQHSDVSSAQQLAAASERPVLRKTTAARQTKQLQPPKTPVRKAKTLSPLRTTQADDKATCVVPYDDATHFLSLIEVTYEAVSAYGDTLAAVRLLKAGRHVVRHMKGAQLEEFLTRFSSLLGRAYLRLGKLSRARAVLRQDVSETSVDPSQKTSLSAQAIILQKLALAEYLCHTGKIDDSIRHVAEAVQLTDSSDDGLRPNSWHNVLLRCTKTEQQANAAGIRASISFARGNLVVAIKESVQSVRLAIKAGMTMVRLTGVKDGDDADNPFVQPKEVKEMPNEERNVLASSGTQNHAESIMFQLSSLPLAALSYRLCFTMLSAYLRTSRLYTIRGSARDAEAFATEAIRFSGRLDINFNTASALGERSGIRIQMGMLGSAAEDIAQASLLHGNEDESLTHAAMTLIQGDHHSREGRHEEALSCYKRSASLIAHLSETFTEADILLPSPPRQAQVDNKDEIETISCSQAAREDLLPQLRSKIFQRQAWLLHLLGRSEESGEALDEAALAADSEMQQADAAVLRGKLMLEESWRSLKRNHAFAMFAEAAFSLPACVTAIEATPSSRRSLAAPRGEAFEVAVAGLSRALTLLNNAVPPAIRSCADSTTLRDACVNKALAQMLLSTLKMEDQRTLANDIINAVDSGSAITLDRELLDAIESKIERKDHVEQKPKLQPRASKAALPRHSRNSARLLDSDGDDSDDNEDGDAQGKTKSDLDAWLAVRQRRLDDVKMGQDLPEGYTVVSIALSRERNSVLITRREGSKEGTPQPSPLVFMLPLDRQSRRDGEDESLNVDDALGELRSIVEESNTATHSAQQLDGAAARKDWWMQRRALDTRLKELVGAIEATWLGIFKGVLLPTPPTRETARTTFAHAVNAVIARACHPNSITKRTPAVEVNGQILDCLCALSPSQVSDEDLEDFIHFALDACHSCGVPVAVDEVDLDICTTDLRSALEAFHGRQSSDTLPQPAKIDTQNVDPHLFLILDKNTSAIPWESIPILRQQAVCRIPSMSFLQDRISMMRDSRLTIRRSEARLWYLLNPSEDLVRTQQRFGAHFNAVQRLSPAAAAAPLAHVQASWRGIAGRAPSLEEFANALETQDVVLYFGHGGGEQYVRPSRLRSMERCAVTMLWGCSSGVLRDMGDFERTGTPCNYMLAGCPSLVANLWDATDKELDGVSESVLRRMGLIDMDSPSSQHQKDEALRGHRSSSSSSSSSSSNSINCTHTPAPARRVSIARAVAESRDACKLPYLTGAACIVYGVPVYYE